MDSISVLPNGFPLPVFLVVSKIDCVLDLNDTEIEEENKINHLHQLIESENIQNEMFNMVEINQFSSAFIFSAIYDNSKYTYQKPIYYSDRKLSPKFELVNHCALASEMIGSLKNFDFFGKVIKKSEPEVKGSKSGSNENKCVVF